MQLTFTPRKKLTMSKNAIHNFNLSIKNSADIKSSEHLKDTIIKELAKVSKEMSQQKDIVQLWQDQQSLNTDISNALINKGVASTISEKTRNQTISEASSETNTKRIVSTGEGANGNSTSFGTTSSVSETTTFSASIGGGVADTTGRMTLSSAESANTTSPILEAENDGLNLDSITTQVYANAGTQQTLTVPQTLQTNTGEPSIEAIKIEIEKKLNSAKELKDIEGIEYWTRLSKAFEEGKVTTDFYDKPGEMKFTELYNSLKQSMVVTSQTFDWEDVREKMIKAIDANILDGKIPKNIRSHWENIQKQLKNDAINVANLFERYNELFLLLKEVKGLDDLPNTISITTKTKIYPNLSPDEFYAKIGKENVYVFLKKISDPKELAGSGVNSGAVKIKNANASSFIVGESLEFVLDETFVKENSEYKKENINWVVYKDSKKQGADFVNEGLSFSYNFDTPGIYKVEAYGKNSFANNKKNRSLAAFVQLEIIQQEIVITPPTTIKDKFIRMPEGEQLFSVGLKNTAVKTLNPLKLYYQVEFIKNKKTSALLEEQELDDAGIVKFFMRDLGKYNIKVYSKGQYSLKKEHSVTVIKNYVESIEFVKNTNNDIYLLSEISQKAFLKAKDFKIEATREEKANVKWLVYDKNTNIYPVEGTKLQFENNDNQKPYLVKGESFEFFIPKEEGVFTIEAYSNSKEGLKSESKQQITVKRPQITEAFWAFSGGSKKQTSGFAGEFNHIKANIPDYNNQTVRIYFYLNNVKTNHYCDVKTNNKGEIFKRINFDSNFEKLIGFQNRKTAKIGFKLIGIQNSKPYQFKTSANYDSDTVLSVTKEKKILDVYFKYEGKKVTVLDQIPLSYSGAFVTIVAKTQNMVGEEIVLTAHKAEEEPIYRNIVKIDSEGKASATFKITRRKGTKVGEKMSYYVGIEGHSTMHVAYKGLIMIVNNDDKNLTWGLKVSKEFRDRVIEICGKIWPENTMEMANGLMAVMYRETNRTFAANQLEGYKVLIPREQMTVKNFEKINKETKEMGSRAVGLIQFTQSALVAMGEFKNGEGFKKLHKIKLEYAKMSDLQQLTKVKKYFKSLAKLPKVPEDIYTAVFSPHFVGKKDSETLYEVGTSDYNSNLSLDKNNDGIQKEELTAKYYESLKEGNKNVNIASVKIKKIKNECLDGKCTHYSDVVENPKINDQSNNINKNRFYRAMRFNTDHPQGYYHTGVDILAQPNTPLKSLLCGIVTESRDTYGDLGVVVTVKSKDKEGKDIWIKYCHLSSTSVVVGEVVNHGEEIGLSGLTGNAKTIDPAYYHVHIEASTNGVFYGGHTRVDPEFFMKTKF